MTAPHSKGSNCVKDNMTLLTNFKEILHNEAESQEIHSMSPTIKSCMNQEAIEPTQFLYEILNEDDEFQILNIPEEMEEEHDLTDIKFQPLVYVSGYLASTLRTLDCAVCRNLLVEENEQRHYREIYQYIQLREWWDDK